MDQDIDKAEQPQRNDTDESLRLERGRADASLAEKRTAAEEEADRVVSDARQLADQVLRTARNDADREHPAAGADGSVEHERAQADGMLEDKRSDEDARRDRERGERKRYLADFLAVERQATDEYLSRERNHADAVVATRDEFLATVSHDIRSLLGGLNLNVSLVLKNAPAGPVGDKMRRHAASSQRLVARMNRLINDLLDLASIEAGKLSHFPEQVEVGKILRDTYAAFEPVAAAKGVELAIDDKARPLHAHLDDGRVLQVLANLVSNAIKFTQPQGRVSIRVRAEGNEIHFAVADTGIGVPEGELEAVFERFRQVDKDRRGLGLGLHISKCIVEAHGGRMWAESKLGAGSTFHFALPEISSDPAPPG